MRRSIFRALVVLLLIPCVGWGQTLPGSPFQGGGGGGTPSFPISAPDGAVGAPSYGFANGTSGVGMFLRASNALGLTVTGVEQIEIISGAVRLAAASQYVWGSSTVTASPDTGLSRSGAAVVAVTDGSSGVGAMKANVQTPTNCSSAAAPAVCAAASAGSVVIAAAGTTVTVNTSLVTANSQIFLMEDSSLGTKLSVTCNTTIARSYVITARTAATSFVITASAAPVTNPACLSYFIVN